MSIESIWRNGRVPVVYRPPGKGELMIRLPFEPGNKHWLRNSSQRRPEWRARYKCWSVPRSWFTDLVRRLLLRYGSTYIVQEVREKEICAPACWTARGLECECSCLGEHHGEGQPGGRWYEISEALAIRWKNRSMRWSLLKRKGTTDEHPNPTPTGRTLHASAFPHGSI